MPIGGLFANARTNAKRHEEMRERYDINAGLKLTHLLQGFAEVKLTHFP
jgi:hypothetical protein